MSNDIESQVLKLPDGRCLGYALYGDPNGYPLFYFHGLPGSRLEGRIIDPVAKELHLRVIAIDRPGYGISDPARQRTLIDWPKDVADLADALRIGKFAVLGVSGGGPCALACAHELAQRVTAVAVVCGLGPLHNAPIADHMRWPARTILRLGRWSTWLLQALVAQPLRVTCRLLPGLVIYAISILNGGPDKPILRRQELKQVLKDNVMEAFRQGTAGAVRDVGIYSRPWGFQLQDIPHAVTLWHGGRDNVVPLSHGQYMHQQLPNSQVLEIAEEGHFSLPILHLREILTRLVPAPSSPAVR